MSTTPEEPTNQPIAHGTIYAYAVIAVTTLWACFLPLPVWVHMLIMTNSIIYIGTHNSIFMSTQKDAEVMETKDVYKFPLVASCALGSLYVVFKLFNKVYVNMLIKAYFIFFGTFVLSQRIVQILAHFLPPALVSSLQAQKKSFTIPSLPFEIPEIPFLSALLSEEPKKKDDKEGDEKKEDDNKIDFDTLDIYGLVLATIFSVWYLTCNHWSANNIFGVVFAVQGIELLNLGSFFNGAILLTGLFFYDIFWVFGTDVMVTVAKSFDAPIKLLFPQPDSSRPSMLGLGDIVIPGIFIALLLRYDMSLLLDKQTIVDSPKLFFKTNMAAYTMGLCLTVAIMYFFDAAQPALLYLVPVCLGSALITSAATGQLKKLLAYDESLVEEKEAADAKKNE